MDGMARAMAAFYIDADEIAHLYAPLSREPERDLKHQHYGFRFPPAFPMS